jgi:D-alanine-D-alanine ligase
MSGQSQRIGVLIDGGSGQREASRRSGEAIAAALADGGHDARPLFVDEHLDLALRQGRFDVAFLALRGSQGADGRVQGLLEWLGIPYTGPGVLASALAMHQEKAREVLRLHNLPIAPGYVLRGAAARRAADHHGDFGYPVAVGPADAGLTRGVGVAHDELELEAAVEECLRFGDEVLVERFVDGQVVVVAVMGGRALGALDLGQRLGSWGPGGLPVAGAATRPREGVRGAAAQQPGLLHLAERASAALKVEGPALVELVVGGRQNEVVRGVESAPLLTPNSVFARIAARAGISFAALVEEILKGASVRRRGHGCEWHDLVAPYEPTAPGRGSAARRGVSLALPH